MDLHPKKCLVSLEGGGWKEWPRAAVKTTPAAVKEGVAALALAPKFKFISTKTHITRQTQF